MNNLKELIAYTGGGITSKAVHKGNNLDVTLFCMARDTEIDEHTSTRSGFVYVIEGKGVFNLEGREIQMLPGVFFR